jgi:hypothetical protein
LLPQASLALPLHSHCKTSSAFAAEAAMGYSLHK